MAKVNVVEPAQNSTSNGQGLIAGIDSVKVPDPRFNKLRPPSRPASRIKAHRPIGEPVPREDSHIGLEHLGKFGVAKGLIREAIPFLTEGLDDPVIVTSD